MDNSIDFIKGLKIQRSPYKLVFIAYAQMHLINAHGEIFNGISGILSESAMFSVSERSVEYRI